MLVRQLEVNKCRKDPTSYFGPVTPADIVDLITGYLRYVNSPRRLLRHGEIKLRREFGGRFGDRIRQIQINRLGEIFVLYESRELHQYTAEGLFLNKQFLAVRQLDYFFFNGLEQIVYVQAPQYDIMTTDLHENIYLAQRGTSQIQVLNRHLISLWPPVALTGLAVKANGELLVTTSDQLLLFSPTGNQKASWDLPITGQLSFQLRLDEAETLILVEHTSLRVFFQKLGGPIEVLPSIKLNMPLVEMVLGNQGHLIGRNWHHQVYLWG